MTAPRSLMQAEIMQAPGVFARGIRCANTAATAADLLSQTQSLPLSILDAMKAAIALDQVRKTQQMVNLTASRAAIAAHRPRP